MPIQVKAKTYKLSRSFQVTHLRIPTPLNFDCDISFVVKRNPLRVCVSISLNLTYL